MRMFWKVSQGIQCWLEPARGLPRGNGCPTARLPSPQLLCATIRAHFSQESQGHLPMPPWAQLRGSGLFSPPGSAPLGQICLSGLLPGQRPCAFSLTLTYLSGSHGNSGLTRVPKSSICLNVEEAAASR